MKLLLDMGLARSTAVFLRAQGYEAVHLREEGLQRLPDDEIIKKARLEERVIVTHDFDRSSRYIFDRSTLFLSVIRRSVQICAETQPKPSQRSGRRSAPLFCRGG